MIAMIDNYDSFTYNIVQELREMEADLRVFRNDAITVDALDALAPAALVVSPGPGRPSEAGISMDAIRRFAGRIPILGVCLGHQAIGEVYGGRIVKAARIMHGKVSEVTCDGAASSSPPPRRTAASWACDTGSSPSTACSSTRSRS